MGVRRGGQIASVLGEEGGEGGGMKGGTEAAVRRCCPRHPRLLEVVLCRFWRFS
jgi:hypothetical protein